MPETCFALGSAGQGDLQEEESGAFAGGVRERHPLPSAAAPCSMQQVNNFSAGEAYTAELHTLYNSNCARLLLVD